MGWLHQKLCRWPFSPACLLWLPPSLTLPGDLRVEHLHLELQRQHHRPPLLLLCLLLAKQRAKRRAFSSRAGLLAVRSSCAAACPTTSRLTESAGRAAAAAAAAGPPRGCCGGSMRPSLLRLLPPPPGAGAGVSPHPTREGLAAAAGSVRREGGSASWLDRSLVLPHARQPTTTRHQSALGSSITPSKPWHPLSPAGWLAGWVRLIARSLT